MKLKFSKLFLFATFFEAKSILNQVEFQKIKKNLFICEPMGVFITGIGFDHIQKSLEVIKEFKPSKIINIGLCGGVSGVKQGDIVSPETFLLESMLHNYNGKNREILISLKKPMYHPEKWIKKYPILALQKKVVVDMEGSFLYNMLNKDGINLKIFKVVSDLGAGSFSENFKKNKAIFLETLSEVAKKQL